MNGNIILINKRNTIHPHKFALWAAMASITMMFGAFTSAYIVKQAAGNWLEFAMPNEFYLSTLMILVSSITLHISFKAFKSGMESRYKLFLSITLLAGLGFVVLQYFGWTSLYKIGVDLKGNVSGSFFYLLSGIHALHVLGGIAALLVAVLHAYTLKFKVTDQRINRFDLVVNYWHFVDFLWIYLFIFLLISK
ncbi:MAG: cytochrome c oxidase subunit 3 [Saprospiraceae bacterium]|jgi:cytochrome c oxidase subunit 3|nr:cytochrome c oxidase subunit 3 [Saprospiraceae bacterium]MBP6446905.1 cytochrome c oxidase subunit 3 [Saprospiraceae bacterium]